MQEAYRSGMVSINHRSNIFENLYQDTELILKEKWQIPQDYSIFFISSATEGWEIVSHSIVLKKSAHFFNGAFGQKWAQYNDFWNPGSYQINFPLQESIEDFLKQSKPDFSEADTICLVHSETSNGSMQIIKRSMLNQQKDTILAVDATSSMGGMELPWDEADIWFASVQKCMGLPAGMGLMICSPCAIERAKKKGKKAKYNNLVFMEENRIKHQTHFTPNVLSIYLLNQLTHYLPYLAEIHRSTIAKSQVINEFFNNFNKKTCDFLINENTLRLPTVTAIKGDESWIKGLLEFTEKNEIILGKGYGEWSKTSFRIANFPSHSIEEIQLLLQLIKSYGL